MNFLIIIWSSDSFLTCLLFLKIQAQEMSHSHLYFGFFAKPRNAWIWLKIIRFQNFGNELEIPFFLTLSDENSWQQVKFVRTRRRRFGAKSAPNISAKMQKQGANRSVCLWRCETQ